MKAPTTGIATFRGVRFAVLASRAGWSSKSVMRTGTRESGTGPWPAVGSPPSASSAKLVTSVGAESGSAVAGGVGAFRRRLLGGGGGYALRKMQALLAPP